MSTTSPSEQAQTNENERIAHQQSKRDVVANVQLRENICNLLADTEVKSTDAMIQRLESLGLKVTSEFKEKDIDSMRTAIRNEFIPSLDAINQKKADRIGQDIDLPQVEGNESISPILTALQESFTQKYPNDSFGVFCSSCSEEDINAISNLKSPNIFCDPGSTGEWIVGDTVNTDSGNDFKTTKAQLEEKGLQLWNEDLFMQERIDGWTWLIANGYQLRKGYALSGGCKGGAAGVDDYGTSYSDSRLGGRGLRRVQRQKS